MTNTPHPQPEEGGWKPSTPDPRWNPTDADLVQGLYGPAAAKMWQEANGARRRGIIRHLMEHGSAHIRLPHAEESAEGIDAVFQEAEDEAREQEAMCAMVFYPVIDRLPDLLVRKEKYEHEIEAKTHLIEAGVGDVEDAKEVRAYRTVQLRMIEVLMQGELTYAACEKLLEGDENVANFDDWERKYEYCRYIEMLTVRGHIDIDPPSKR